MEKVLEREKRGPAPGDPARAVQKAGGPVTAPQADGRRVDSPSRSCSELEGAPEGWDRVPELAGNPGEGPQGRVKWAGFRESWRFTQTEKWKVTSGIQLREVAPAEGELSSIGWEQMSPLGRAGIGEITTQGF